MRIVRVLATALALGAAAGPARAEGWFAKPWFDWRWRSLGQPCAGECAVMAFGGSFVKTAMTDIFLHGDVLPTNWRYGPGSILGVNASRIAATAFDGALRLEPEVGIAKRFGNMDEVELWGALYLRYARFPWDDYVRTSIAVSTGLNYATGISAIERSRAGAGSNGSRVLHYLAPELTLALPALPEVETVFRFHHRSGAYGLVSDARGGAHYATVGVRWRF